MKCFFSFFFLCFAILLSSQDAYHLQLIDQLKTEYNLENGSYVLDNEEIQNNNDIYVYGQLLKTNSEVSNFDFSKIIQFNATAVGNNPWESGIGISNKKTILQDDIVLLVFWARKTSEASSLSLFIEDNATFEKEVYTDISFTQDWSQYLVAFKSSKTYSINTLNFGFHTANAIQTFEIGGYTAINFAKNYDLDDVPSIYNPKNYGGHEADAAWRAEAADRIENIRRADLEITVVDELGNPVSNADVQIDMTKHQFGFGSALVTCRFPGNDCYDATYMSKIENLDGQGHGFNMAVTENALKWDGWEEEWIGTPTETKSAIQYLSDRDIEVRGHTLIWPGWGNLPSDLEQNKDDLDYLRQRISDRIETMLTDEVIGTTVTEWDVLNEITTNRDLEASFEGKEEYITGRELYPEIFQQITSLKPNHVNYINDYVTLSNGGIGEATTNRYKSFLTEIKDSGVKLDGIGFQCHIGPFPTSILKLKETFDEFDELYDVEMKVTEYDIDNKVDPEVQATYLTDFLTMVYSYPKMNAFIMWGFYDGNHWKNNAVMYDENWNIKPSGQAFNDLVFGEWWTNDNGLTNASGVFTSRVYKGEHDVTITVDGKTTVVRTNVTSDDTLTIQLGVTNTSKLKTGSINLVPNPANGSFRIEVPRNNELYEMQIYGVDGKIIYKDEAYSGQIIDPSLMPGSYQVELTNQESRFVNTLIIH